MNSPRRGRSRQNKLRAAVRRMEPRVARKQKSTKGPSHTVKKSDSTRSLKSMTGSPTLKTKSLSLSAKAWLKKPSLRNTRPSSISRKMGAVALRQ
ncbi:Uncharacterised protein [Flavonifractor plautii]|uniref:Uncharacterized protein n=1 Tax=Flavonifractor plautii TaxID=292800 RepID=A0A174I495_FLAPL|nr:Uncharacterised protein [Flavonifractor plautii]